MKKFKISGYLFLLSFIIITLLPINCFDSDDSNSSSDATEFEGTWIYTNTAGTTVISFTKIEHTITSSGTSNGTLNLLIHSYDETANHIYATVTSGTGDQISLSPVGSIFYIYYEIDNSGNVMMINKGDTSYPTTAISGPFIKQ